MDNETYARTRADIKAKEASIIRNSGLFIRIYGPKHGSATYPKRVQIRDGLRAVGFENAEFPEIALGTDDYTYLLIAEEEERRSTTVGQDHRLYLVLETAEGPLAEVSAWVRDIDFKDASYILYPCEYANGSFPDRAIIGTYEHVFKYTPKQYLDCEVAREAVRRATAKAFNVWVKASRPPKF